MRKKTDKHAGFTLTCPPKPWRRRKPLRRQAGAAFTLIELLVVIAIIGLLTAILVPTITGALNSAKRARALSQIQDLDGALKRYFAEYGKMPVPVGGNGGDDKLFTGADQAAVIEILINSPYRTDTNANPRQIVFLDLDPASFNDANGDPLKTIVEMLDALHNDHIPYKDPWGDSYEDDGHDYGILMDLNFDEKITGTTGGFADIRAKVAVFSIGEKEDIENPPFKTW